jgi:magnesium-transporting ATPase (P-type)
MLSGESTPLLKESIQLLDGTEALDVDGSHKGAVLFSGTKVLQASVGGKLLIIWLVQHSSSEALFSHHGHINHHVP